MKLKNIILVFVATIYSVTTLGQKYFTKTGKISFFSSTSMENIEAHNRSVSAVLDASSGNLQFSVLMKGFEFKKALMQEHFNKDYVESDKYPKAEFKGTILNNGDIKYDLDGVYNTKVKGQLTIHGQTKDIETSGSLTIKEGKIKLASTFNVLVADYNIVIPRIYRDNISKNIKVSVDCTVSPL